MKKGRTMINEDKALIAVLKNSNSPSREKEQAFRKLYSRHSKQVLFFFLTRTKNETLSKDLRMITFGKVYISINQYDDTYAFSTWLYRIAMNSFLDEVKKAKKNTLSINYYDKENNETEFQVASKDFSPQEILARKERAKEVREALFLIEDDFMREVMNKRFLEEMTFEQIAEEMNVPNNSTLRVTVRRGKKLLLEALKNVANPY